MIDRQELRIKYEETESYSETGRYFGISRQRVHQLLTGYTTNPHLRKGKGKWGLNKAVKERWGQCEDCSKPSTAIHHLDGNSHNNQSYNLRIVCGKCHGKYHRGEHKSRYRGKICKGLCGRTIVNLNMHGGGGYCKMCRLAKKEGRTPASLLRKDNCGICEKDISRSRQLKGCCYNCYRQWRYFYDNNFKASLKRQSDSNCKHVRSTCRHRGVFINGYKVFDIKK